jgi:DNA-binding response OmpR family regulator
MTAKKNRIFLVEDDASMGFLLVDYLKSQGFRITLENHGDTGWKAFQNGEFDLCVLDVMLPGEDGFSIAERIRQINQDIPIIFLTARSMKQDKLKGFNLGGDDYVTKPFDEEELLCRIKAILNRYSKVQNGVDERDEYDIGSYCFDPANQLLSLKGQSRRLTAKENRVLEMLCRRLNSIVKRDDILIHIWGDNDYFNGRSLDVFIAKLRKYLSEDEQVQIENIPKVGYVLNTKI